MAAQHDPKLEQLSRQFLEAEITSGLTGVQLATTAYRHGDRADGDMFTAKATRACAKVEWWLREAEARGWGVADLRQQLRTVHAALADLQARARKAA